MTTETIVLNLPALWCKQCPYPDTLENCEDDKPCHWQLDYANQILSSVRSAVSEIMLTPGLDIGCGYGRYLRVFALIQSFRSLVFS
jgi:hypothetical protein